MASATVVRHYQHGRLELHQGNVWWIYVEDINSGEYEFLDTRVTLKQAEDLYFSWWEA